MPQPARTAIVPPPARDRALFAATLAVVVLTWLAVGLASWRGREDALDDWRFFLSNLSEVVAQQADQTLAAADGVLGRVVDDVRQTAPRDAADFVARAGTRGMNDLLRRRQADLPQIEVLSLVALDGRLVNFSRGFPVPPYDLAGRDFLNAHLADDGLALYLSAPVRSRASGQWTFYLTRKIRAVDGRTIGVAVAGIECGYFQRFYQSIDSARGGLAVTLMRRDGLLLARHPPPVDAAIGSSLATGEMFRRMAPGMPAPPSTVMISGPRPSDHRDTLPRLVAPNILRDYPVIVEVVATRERILAQWRRTTAALVTINLVFNAGLVLLAVWISRVARRRREILRELRTALAAADAGSRAKTAFLANISHEIRTPMNGILGMTELLLQTPLEPRQRTLASSAHASGQTLLHLLNDVLDVSKIEAGKLLLEQVDFDLRSLLAGEMDLVRAAAAAAGLALSDEIDPALPCQLRGDPTRLRQVLRNLLSNAIKFTPRGGRVRLVARRAGADQGGHRVAFEVHDSGIGISAEAQARLFQPFTQADESTTRRFGGTGLGLAISKELVTLMGGRMALESTPELGSVFRVELTLQPAQAPQPPASPSGEPGSAVRRFAGLRVLLAEDNAVNQQVAVAMLEGLGARVECAADGVQAVALCREGRFDVLLLDIQMPGMDGYEAARRIRADGGNDLPIIALTANAMSTDRALCLAAGMDDYLAKPLTRDALAAMLAKWTGRPPAAAAP